MSSNFSVQVSLSKEVVGVITTAPNSPRLKLPQEVTQALGLSTALSNKHTLYRRAIQILQDKDEFGVLFASEEFRRACISRHGCCKLPGSKSKNETKANIEYIEQALDQQQKGNLIDAFHQPSPKSRRIPRAAKENTCMVLLEAIRKSRFKTIYNAYAAIDHKCTGRISRHEVKKGLLKLGLRVSDGDIHKHVAMFCSFVQTDALGKVTFRDFWNTFEGGKRRFEQDTSSSKSRNKDWLPHGGDACPDSTNQAIRPGTSVSEWSSNLRRSSLPDVIPMQVGKKVLNGSPTKPSQHKRSRRHSTGAALLIPHSIQNPRNILIQTNLVSTPSPKRRSPLEPRVLEPITTSRSIGQPSAVLSELASVKGDLNSPAALSEVASVEGDVDSSTILSEVASVKGDLNSPATLSEAAIAKSNVDSQETPFNSVLKGLRRVQPSLQRGSSLAQFIGTIVRLQHKSKNSARSNAANRKANASTPTSLPGVREGYEKEDEQSNGECGTSDKSAMHGETMDSEGDVLSGALSNVQSLAGFLSQVVRMQGNTKNRLKRHPLHATHRSFLEAMQSSRALQKLTSELQMDNIEELIDDDELELAAQCDSGEEMFNGLEEEDEFDSKLFNLINNTKAHDAQDQVSENPEGKAPRRRHKVRVSRWSVIKGLQGFHAPQPTAPAADQPAASGLRLPHKGWRLARWMRPVIGLQANETVKVNRKQRVLQAREQALSEKLKARDSRSRPPPSSPATCLEPAAAAQRIQRGWRTHVAYGLSVALRLRLRPERVTVRGAGERTVIGSYERVGRQNDAPFFVKEPAGALDSTMALIERMPIGDRHCWVIALVSLATGQHSIAYLNDRSTRFTEELPPSAGWQLGNGGTRPSPICELESEKRSRKVYRIQDCGMAGLNGVTLEEAGTVDGVSNFQGLCAMGADGALSTTLVMRRIEQGEYGDFMWILAGVSLDTGTTKVFYVNIDMGALKTPPLFGWICGQDGEYPVPELVEEAFSVDHIREQLRRGAL